MLQMIYLAGQETLVIEETVREGDASRVTGAGGSKIGDGSGKECRIEGDGVEKEVIQESGKKSGGADNKCMR